MPNDPRPIRFGILGSGLVAAGFADDIRHVPGCRLEAVASRRVERAQAFAARFGARCHLDTAALVADPSIDVVYVATPNHRHADDVLACLEGGKAVVCEKPLTVSADQCGRVVEAARSAGLFCMEAMWMRFVPAVRRTIDLATSGELGEIRAVHADFSITAPVIQTSRLFDPAQGGGALLDLGVYPLSLAQAVLGEPASASAALHMGPTGVDEHAALLLEYPSGATAVLTASIRHRGPNAAVIAGTRGTVRLPGPICAPRSLVVERFDPSASPEASPSARGRLASAVRSRPVALGLARTLRSARAAVPIGGGHERHDFAGAGYRFEITEVERCLRAGLVESPAMSLAESLRVAELIDRLRTGVQSRR